MRIYDPQARRHSQIITMLSRAANDYLRARNHLSIQQSRERKSDIFGVVEPPILKLFATSVEQRPQRQDPIMTPASSQFFCDGQHIPSAELEHETMFPPCDIGIQAVDQYNKARVADILSTMQTQASSPTQKDATLSLNGSMPREQFNSLVQFDMASYNDILPLFNVFGELASQAPPFPDDWNFVVPTNP